MFVCLITQNFSFKRKKRGIRVVAVFTTRPSGMFLEGVAGCGGWTGRSHVLLLGRLALLVSKRTHELTFLFSSISIYKSSQGSKKVRLQHFFTPEKSTVMSLACTPQSLYAGLVNGAVAIYARADGEHDTGASAGRQGPLPRLGWAEGVSLCTEPRRMRGSSAFISPRPEAPVTRSVLKGGGEIDSHPPSLQSQSSCWLLRVPQSDDLSAGLYPALAQGPRGFSFGTE